MRDLTQPATKMLH